MASPFGSHSALALSCDGIVLEFLAFTDTHSRIYRVIGGLLHSVAHFSAMFYIRLGRARRGDAVIARERGAPVGAGRRRHLRWRMDRGFSDHGDLPAGVGERLRPAPRGSVQRPQDRGLQALPAPARRPRGQLTIWPIKIGRVPRRWRDRGASDTTMSRVVPDEPMPVELIEPQIRLH